MTHNDIQHLIDRYLAAETTAEEERLLALELQRDDIPEEWQAVRLMLDELTLGEALYDEILASRPTTSADKSPDHTHRHLFSLWRWAVAACIVLVAGLGIALYKGNLFIRPTSPVLITNENKISHQRKESVPLLEQPDAPSLVSSQAQSRQHAQPAASAKANRRKRKAVQPSNTPSSTEMPSPSQEERVEELLLAVADAELQAMDVQHQPLSSYDDPYAAIEAEMRDIRNRGEHVEAMIAEVTRQHR